jgi:hypothetical protein
MRFVKHRLTRQIRRDGLAARDLCGKYGAPNPRHRRVVGRILV